MLGVTASCHPALLRPRTHLGTTRINIWLFLPQGFHPESQESSSLLQTAVSVLQSCYLDSTSQDGFQYSQAILVENAVFLNEVIPLGELEAQETVAFLWGPNWGAVGAVNFGLLAHLSFLCSVWLTCLPCRAPFVVPDWGEPLLCFLLLLPSQSDQEQRSIQPTSGARGAG